MPGESQDKHILETDQEYDTKVAQKRCPSWRDTRQTERFRHAGSPQRFRERISFADADALRSRVESCAARVGVRGARRCVLSAVLGLLCGWKRLDDDAVRLPQILAAIVAAGGRAYDLKTIGRALASLAADELIIYRAAQGRGTTALIGIHSQFVGDITVLKRDANNRVIAPATPDSVTFSRRSPYKKSNKTPRNPPASTDTTEPSTSAPIEVSVSTTELREVLAALPEPFATLPRNLKWALGRKIRAKLAAGWLPSQIRDQLAAPLPEQVRLPYRLAIRRLTANMPGQGPRLKKLQQAADRRENQAAKDRDQQLRQDWFQRVRAATTEHDQQRILRAHTIKFGPPTSTELALAQAGRRATRLFPHTPLQQGLTRWANDVLAAADPVEEPREPTAPTPEAGNRTLIDMAIGDHCLVCTTRHGRPRHQMPLPIPVCDHCWPMLAAEADIEIDEPRWEPISA